MTDVRVRGTTDPVEIAVVLAVLQHDAASPAPDGISAWRDGRRAALATRRTGRSPRHDR